jgi:hypothetical protein
MTRAKKASNSLEVRGFNAFYVVVLGLFAADNKHFTLHVNGKEYPAKIGA